MTRRTLLTTLATLALPENIFAAPPVVPAMPSFPVGSGGFAYMEPEGSPYAGVNIPVRTYRPASVDPATTSRVLIVLHGVQRDGMDYSAPWIALAEQYQFLLLVPEFTQKDFSTGIYNRGNVRGEDDKSDISAARWIFPIIERLFAYYKMVARNPVRGYYLYGDSDGAQFVHRLVEFLPTARIVRAVAADADYYTLPYKATEPYPFSRTGTPNESEAARRTIFAQPLTVLLSAVETDSGATTLFHSPEADRQGLTRIERGKYFYHAAKEAAENDNLFFNWHLVTLPETPHENARLASAAAKILFE